MFTISFFYHQKAYQAVITEKDGNGHKIYRITVMNGELENLLKGNTLIEKEGKILCSNPPENDEQGALLLSIRQSLIARLRTLVN